MGRLKLALLALHVRVCIAQIKVSHRLRPRIHLHFRVWPFYGQIKARVDGVKEDPAELLHVLLLIRLRRGPAKTIGQVLGCDEVAFGELQCGEQFLQLEGDAFLLGAVFQGVILVRVNVLANFRRHIECLQ